MSRTAYIDESGTDQFPFPQGDRFFCCVAVLVDKENTATVEDGLRAIEHDICQLKSSNIGNDWRKRLHVIDRISALPLNYWAFMVDKAALSPGSPGIRHRSSFRKKMLSILARDVASMPGGTDIVFDSYGRADFQNELTTLIGKVRPQTLFQDGISSVQMMSSEEVPAIRCADFIAGSLRRLRMDLTNASSPNTAARAIRAKLLNVQIKWEVWPSKIHEQATLDPPTEGDSKFSLANASSVKAFLELHATSATPSRHLQAIALQTLVDQAECGLGSMPASELADVLSDTTGTRIDTRYLRNEVIGPLRDFGVTITGSHNGYRIAERLKDVAEYLASSESVVGPMLRRAKHAAQAYHSATGISVWDLLPPTQMRDLINALGN